MINTVMLIGRLGANPDVRDTTKGDKYASLSLATNERYKGKDGEYKEKTQWHKVMVFNPNIAESLSKYRKQGDMVHIQGQIEYRSYEVDGETKYVTEIVVPRFKGVVQLIPTKNSPANSTGKSNGPIAQAKADMQDDPVIPF